MLTIETLLLIIMLCQRLLGILQHLTVHDVLCFRALIVGGDVMLHLFEAKPVVVDGNFLLEQIIIRLRRKLFPIFVATDLIKWQSSLECLCLI